MKGLDLPIGIAIAIIGTMFFVYIAFVAFDYVSGPSKKSASTAIEGPGGLIAGAVVSFAPLAKRKKGFALTTEMLAIVISCVTVAFFLFLMFGKVETAAPSTTNSLLYGFFDALTGFLPR